MTHILTLTPPACFAAIAAITSLLAVACGGSVTISGDHNVAGASGGTGDTGGTGALGGVGSSGGRGGIGGTTGNAVKLAPGSWQVTGVVTEAEVNSGVQPCATLAFTLNVASDGSGYLATIGQDGFIDGATAQITNGSYVLGGLSLPCGNQLTVSGLTLQGTDADGDGNADGLSGSVQGMAYSGGGDVAFAESVQIAFTGIPDVTAPTLLQPGIVDPLLGLDMVTSEPVADTASLTLTGSPTVPLLVMPASSFAQHIPLHDVIRWSASNILPLSGQWNVQGEARDPSGYALDRAGVVVRTLADPGVFAQDGFEGSLVAAIESGTPSIVTARGSLTAISGAHSLWIAPGDAVLFHLKGPASERSVHFSARAFTQEGSPSFDADMRAGVVGGKLVATPNFTSASDLVDSGDAMWRQASAVVQFTFPLSEPGSDVLLRIAPSVCNGFCAPPSALMLDDLRLE